MRYRWYNQYLILIQLWRPLERAVSLKSLLIGAVIVAVGGAVPAYATEYLTNGSFETGDFTGWTYSTSGDPTFTDVVPTIVPFNGQGAQDGNYYVQTGALIADNASLSQSFADSAGETLKISGWVSGVGDTPSKVALSLNGITVTVEDSALNEPWTQITFTATASGFDTFSVGFGDDPGLLALDNFSVSSISAVPEPGTWALLLLGFAGFGLLRYRRRNTAELAI
jgi:hypothetical protein